MRPLKITLLSLAFLGLASLGARSARAGVLDGTYRGRPGGATYVLHETSSTVLYEYYDFTYRGLILQGGGRVRYNLSNGQIRVRAKWGTLAGRLFTGRRVSAGHLEIYNVPPRPGWPVAT